MTERKEQIKAGLKSLAHFLGVRLWDEDLKRQEGLRGFLYRELRILVVVTRSLSRGQIPLRAAVMTVGTLLALIPMIVLTFTLVGAFGGLEGIETQLRRFIIQNLVAAVQEQASGFLTKFLEGVHTGAFKGISVFFLLGAVLFLLSAVEDAFNQIWGIKRGRSIAHRLTTYTTIAVLAPFLIGISLTASVSMQSAEIFVRLQAWAPMGDFLAILFGFLPILITVLGLTFLYVVMPNTRVGITSAFPSALVAGVIWELSKWGYGSYLSSRTMYTTLYGSLTAIPLLILWIQFSWVIVLGGALLTFAREAADQFIHEEGAVTASHRERLRAALRCMIAVARKHARGDAAPYVSELASELHIPVRLVRAIVGDLLAGTLLHEVVRHTSKGEGGLVPAKDLQSLTVYDVVTCLQSVGTAPHPRPGGPEDTEVDQILVSIDGALGEKAGHLTFAQIIDKLDRDPEAPAPVKFLKRP